MLQQGRFAADILYVYGQGSNITALFGTKLPPIPEGYNYDFLNAGAVPKVLSVKDGRITTGTGMNYKILALDESTRFMTLPVLEKIEALVKAGAVIVGPKPVDTPSLNDDDAEFSNLAGRLWAEGRGIMIQEICSKEQWKSWAIWGLNRNLNIPQKTRRQKCGSSTVLSATGTFTGSTLPTKKILR